MRESIMNEIISTERDYISDLNILVNVFLFPIKLKEVISIDDINILFSNVETLVNCNTQLLKDWETEKKTQNETQKSDIEILGEIFMKMSPFFKMYTVYCANQPNSMLKLEECKKK
jgi:hypothetical protein